jgi:hypothetical protein
MRAYDYFGDDAAAREEKRPGIYLMVIHMLEFCLAQAMIVA